MSPETKKIISEHVGKRETLDALLTNEIEAKFPVVTLIKFQLAEDLRSSMSNKDTRSVISVLRMINSIDETNANEQIPIIQNIIQNLPERKEELEGGAWRGGGGGLFFLGALFLVTAITSAIPR
jgi:hypothetical protein